MPISFHSLVILKVLFERNQGRNFYVRSMETTRYSGAHKPNDCVNNSIAARFVCQRHTQVAHTDWNAFRSAPAALINPFGNRIRGGCVYIRQFVFTRLVGPRCLVHPGQLITVVWIHGPLTLLTTVADHRVWLGFRANYGNTPLYDAVADDNTAKRARSSF